MYAEPRGGFYTVATGDHARSDDSASRNRRHMLWHDSRTFTCKCCSRSGTKIYGTSSQSILRHNFDCRCEAIIEARVHVMLKRVRDCFIPEGVCFKIPSSIVRSFQVCALFHACIFCK